MPSISRDDLVSHLAEYLDVARFHDYCPNGLQVEGRAAITRIVTGVTASLALIERAIDFQADALIVHHGFFWRGEDPRLVGPRRARIARLLAHEINLLAYHLPLDAHREIGNNAQLAECLGLRIEDSFGEQSIGLVGAPTHPVTLGEFARLLENKLCRTPLVIGDPARAVRKVAWCTGAAQSMIDSAAATGADVFVTGEASEQTVHFAREANIGFIAAGHHATERYGVQALGRYLAERYGLAHEFVDVDNPV